MVSTRGLKVDFAPGECVLCFEPDLSKARVLYDAKVCDIVKSKNKQGNRRIEYLVHFQGWNSSWDRVVPASFVVKSTDRNRRLMRKLAEIARRVKRNRARMRRIDNILKEHFQERPKFDSDSSSSESSEDSDEEGDITENGNENGDTEEESDTATEDEENNFRRNGRLQESESEDEKETLPLECHEPKEVILELPGNLRRKLEQDCIMINRKDKLLGLPAEPNIITVLESYVKNFGVNVLCATVEKQKPYTLREQHVDLPERNIDLCKEMMDGLRIFFDFALPTVLLYGPEKEQYQQLQVSKKILVKVPNEVEETNPNPKLSTSKVGHMPSTSEPRSKVPKLSPRILKKEPQDVSDDDFGPPRRITRKAFQEEVRRSNLKNSESTKMSCEVDSPETGEVTPDGKRRVSTCPKSEPKSPAKSLRSSGRKSEKTGKASRDRGQKTLADRVSPPPPLSLQPGSMSSSSSAVETPTSSNLEQSLFQHREAAVNEIFSWRMLPDAEYEKIPVQPSLVYGAHHLLRLFVKLPESMEKMPIPSARLKAMVKHLEMFIEHLSSRAEELFPESAYVDADEVFG